MSEFDVASLFTCTVIDSEGAKVGSIGQVYLDDKTQQPTWVSVKTGFFGLKETFVPLHRAELIGSQLRVPYLASLIKAAPNVDPDRHLDADQEVALYDYYSLSGAPAPSPHLASAHEESSHDLTDDAEPVVAIDTHAANEASTVEEAVDAVQPLSSSEPELGPVGLGAPHPNDLYDSLRDER